MVDTCENKVGASWHYCEKSELYAIDGGAVYCEKTDSLFIAWFFGNAQGRSYRHGGGLAGVRGLGSHHKYVAHRTDTIGEVMDTGSVYAIVVRDKDERACGFHNVLNLNVMQ